MAIFSSSEITNQAQENRIFKVRLKFIIAFLSCAFILILTRVVYLQVINHQEQIERSEAYHIRWRAIPPERGLIYDSSGQVLASNRLSYALYVHPLKLQNLEKLMTDLRGLIALDEELISEFNKNMNNSHSLNQLIFLRDFLTEEEIARLMVSRFKLHGIEIQPKFQRFYPQGNLTSHVVGHIGRISENDETRIDAIQADYRGLDFIGKLGIEKFYEPILKGKQGLEEVGVNAYGREVKVYREEKPIKGQDLVLWIDSDIQQFVWETMGKDKGAVIVVDTNTGGILSMVSKPSYNNNLFVEGISRHEFDKMRNDNRAPLLNRAVAGRYPPGSTIKPFYSIIALSNNVVTPSFTIHDPGYFKLPNSSIVFRNWKKGGHGKVNLRRAIRVSSDTYFYNLANEMGYKIMRDGLQRFGFGHRTSLDVYGEYAAPLPDSDWKIKKHDLPWFPGDTVNMGIGQGYFLASPLQLVAATLILANRGLDIQPRLVKTINEEEVYPAENKLVVNSSDAHWDLVFEGMKDVLHDKEGTARRAGREAAYPIAGKTGTSQVISLKIIEDAQREGLPIKDEWKDHALYLGFVPADEPKYAIVMVLENGGSGSRAAVLSRIITDYLIFEHDKIGLEETEGEITGENWASHIIKARADSGN